MKHLQLVLFGLFLCFFANAQRTKDGSITLSVNRILNEYTEVLADITAGQKVLSVQNSALNANARFSNGLAAGDLIYIYQAQGATINFAADDSTYGEVTAYNNAGNYEFVEVESVPNANTINLVCGVKNNYTATGNVQVVRVPRLNNLTINSNDSLQGEPWDGAKGGIVVVEVAGLLTLNGVIDASALGFRGGSPADNADSWGLNFITTNASWAAEKGESIVGFKTEYDGMGGRYGRGAPANGGGGGCSSDAGGGGGANAGNVGNYSGYGMPDLTDPNYVTAWNLEWAGLGSHTSSGGGRGGHTDAGSVQNPQTTAPWDVSWGGNNRRSIGGRGGRPLDYTQDKFFFGGGGGAGDNNNFNYGQGGSGGGLIHILSEGNITGIGKMVSNGDVGESHNNSNFFSRTTDGGGGAGGGGAIVVKTKSTISGISLEADGGEGGSINQVVSPFFNSADISKGPGGGGGGGFITASNAITSQVNGGKSGMLVNDFFTTYPMNGATDGGVGEAKTEVFSPIEIDVPDQTICTGTSVTLTATVQNGNAANVEWFTGYSDGTPISTGATFNTPNINTQTTYYVGLCGLEYRDTVVINVGGGVVADAGNDTSICSGSSVQLTATGGTTYLWWPNVDINDVNIANPTVNPTSTQKYYVEVDAGGGCKDTDSVVVTISPNLAVNLGADKTICQGDSVDLVSGIGTSWNWTPNNSISSQTDSVVKVYPTDTIMYYLNASDASGCSGLDSIQVIVIPQLVVNQIVDATLCEGDCYNVSVATTGGGGTALSYVWSDLATGQNRTICPTGDSALTVTVLEAASGCSDNESFNLSISTITPDFSVSAACLNSPMTFTDASNTTNSTITSWNWDLGNGNTQTTNSFNHTYNTTGAQNVKLVVENGLGCKDSITKSVSVVDPPVAKIGNNDTAVCLVTELTFVDSSASGQNITKWYWNFNNGDSATTQNATYTYQVAGIKEVELTVENSFGCVGKDTMDLEIYGAPVASVTLPAEVAYGEKVDVTNNTTNATSFEWQYQGTVVSTNKDLSIAFNNVGPNCVELAVIDLNGCTDTTTACTNVLPAGLGTPNVFTPNEDNFNDFFVLSGTEGRVIQLNVYNRWGKLVYSESDYKNDWAGLSITGGKVAAGNYFYVVTDTNTGESWNGYLRIVY